MTNPQRALAFWRLCLKNACATQIMADGIVDALDTPDEVDRAAWQELVSFYRWVGGYERLVEAACSRFNLH